MTHYRRCVKTGTLRRYGRADTGRATSTRRTTAARTTHREPRGRLGTGREGRVATTGRQQQVGRRGHWCVTSPPRVVEATRSEDGDRAGHGEAVGSTSSRHGRRVRSELDQPLPGPGVLSRMPGLFAVSHRDCCGQPDQRRLRSRGCPSGTQCVWAVQATRRVHQRAGLRLAELGFQHHVAFGERRVPRWSPWGGALLVGEFENAAVGRWPPLGVGLGEELLVRCRCCTGWWRGRRAAATPGEREGHRGDNAGESEVHTNTPICESLTSVVAPFAIVTPQGSTGGRLLYFCCTEP